MSWGGIKRNTTDALFSDLVRSLSTWKCERCFRDFSTRKQQLHCSHFYGRRGRSTRWDLDNAAAICSGCHNYFGEHPNEHREFFLKRLGETRFEMLVRRANTPAKVDEKLVRIWLRKQMEEL